MNESSERSGLFGINDLPFCGCGRFLFIASSAERARSIFEVLKKRSPGLRCCFLPKFDSSISLKNSSDIDVFLGRAAALSEITFGNCDIIITTLKSSLYKTIEPSAFKNALHISVGDHIFIGALEKQLAKLGYGQRSIVDGGGQFSIRGGIVDVFPVASNVPFRIDLFGNVVEKIKVLDVVTQLSLKEERQNIAITRALEIVINDKNIAGFKNKFSNNFGYIPKNIISALERYSFYGGIEYYLSYFYNTVNFLDYISNDLKIYFDFELEKYEKELWNTQTPEDFPQLNEIYSDLSSYKAKFSDIENISLKDYSNDVFNIRKQEEFTRLFNIVEAESRKVVVVLKSNASLEIFKNTTPSEYKGSIHTINYFSEASDRYINLIVINSGFSYSNDEFLIFSEKEVFSENLKISSKPKEKVFKNYNNLEVNDYVVHKKHGVGLFCGLDQINVNDLPHDFFKIKYLNDDILYIPVENADLLAKYGDANSEARLDSLKSSSWGPKVERVRQKIFVVAEGLIKIAAKRAMIKGDLYEIPENYDDFVKSFPYLETEDQQRSIDETLDDLKNGILMDRLVCGDVGYGKTEIAIRAAFVVSQKKQVALLAPTTILTRQHYNAFKARLEPFGIRVCELSRFISKKQQEENIKLIESGDVDVIIATHSLLSKRVKFFDLGLLIIDEEQHFGVKQKESIKDRNENINILTMSATPIPRTLQMSISGIRDLSIITTPPPNRLQPHTYVIDYDEQEIVRIIETEVARGGQVFFVTPRIESLQSLKDVVDKINGISSEIASGQMKSSEVEDVIIRFTNNEINVLISTNIIDSGIDIPNANTIIIHRSDLFGLSQLYQLRGRVGRSCRHSFAYFLLPDERALSQKAQQRIEMIQKLSKEGGGFELANFDMDLRGVGNLVGEEQSGYIREIGLEMYQSLLQEAILKIRSGIDKTNKLSPTINIPMPIIIPEDYVQDIDTRMYLYRKIGDIETEQELGSIEFELIDRFGPMPKEVINFLFVIKLKLLCIACNIEKIDIGAQGILISFYDNIFPNPEGLLEFFKSPKIIDPPGTKLRPDHKLFIKRKWRNLTELKSESLIVLTLLRDRCPDKSIQEPTPVAPPPSVDLFTS